MSKKEKKERKTLKDLLGSFEAQNEEVSRYIDTTFPLYHEPGELFMATGDFSVTSEPIGDERHPLHEYDSKKGPVRRVHRLKEGMPLLYLGYELYDDLDYLPWWLIGEKKVRAHIPKWRIVKAYGEAGTWDQPF